MWPKFYRNYPVDGPLIKKKVSSGKGIVGCEMHELNGWGLSYHRSPEDWRRLGDAERRTHLGSDHPVSSMPNL